MLTIWTEISLERGVEKMFLLTEIKWQIFCNKGRSILLCLIAALLTGSMAFYVGNIQSNRKALNELGDNIPVSVTLVNGDGSVTGGVRVSTQQYDDFTALSVENVRASVGAAGAMSEAVRAQEPFEAGDVMIAGINCIEACGVPETLFTFAEGQSAELFTGEEALCAIDELFAQENELKLGDKLELPVYLYAGGISGYLLVDQNASLTVAAFYGAADSSGNTIQVYVPAQWMRTTMAANGGKVFFYDSLSATAKEPLKLNALKDGLTEMGLNPIRETPLSDSEDTFEANAVSVEDELFIKTAVKLQQNIAAYERFLIPFFGLIVGLMTLVVFLLLRNSRQEIAIASSLGRSKVKTGLGHFLSVFLISLLGTAAAFLCMILSGVLSAATALQICGSFLLCAGVGAVIGLVPLLRFDAMELLTKVD